MYLHFVLYSGAVLHPEGVVLYPVSVLHPAVVVLQPRGVFCTLGWFCTPGLLCTQVFVSPPGVVFYAWVVFPLSFLLFVTPVSVCFAPPFLLCAPVFLAARFCFSLPFLFCTPGSILNARGSPFPPAPASQSRGLTVRDRQAAPPNADRVHPFCEPPSRCVCPPHRTPILGAQEHRKGMLRRVGCGGLY